MCTPGQRGEGDKASDWSSDLILASDWPLKQLSSLSLIGYSHLLKAPANRSMYRSKVSFKFNFS